MTEDSKPEDYDTVIDAIHEDFEPRAMNRLHDIKVFLHNVFGWESTNTYDMDDEEYQWHFTTGEHLTLENGDASETGIDVSLTLGEAIVFGDGGVDGEFPYGVSFRLDFVGYGGQIIGGIAPYNYTPECWVDGKDRSAVEERFALVESASLHELPNLIEDYLVATDPAPATA